MNFKITYASGLVEETDCSDWNNASDVATSKFGTSLEEVEANGATIELIDAPAEEKPAEEEPAEEKPAEEEPAEEEPAEG